MHNLLCAGIMCVDMRLLRKKKFVLIPGVTEVKRAAQDRSKDVLGFEIKIILRSLRDGKTNEEAYLRLEKIFHRKNFLMAGKPTIITKCNELRRKHGLSRKKLSNRILDLVNGGMSPEDVMIKLELTSGQMTRHYSKLRVSMHRAFRDKETIRAEKEKMLGLLLLGKANKQIYDVLLSEGCFRYDDGKTVDFEQISSMCSRLRNSNNLENSRKGL